MKLIQIIGFIFFISIPAFSQNLKLVTPVGHTDGIWSLKFSPDNKQILTASRDATVKVWDVATGRLLHNFTDHTNPVISGQFSSDGTKILSIGRKGSIKIWEMTSGKLFHDLTLSEVDVYDAQFSPDGQKVVIPDMDLTIRVWDVTSGKVLHEFTGKGDMDPGVLLSGHFSPDGKQVIGKNWKTINIWDVASGELLHVFAEHPDGVQSVHFSPDGKMIVSGCYDGSIKLWDLSTGKTLLEFKGHSESVNSTHFSPDGQSIVSASDDGTVKIWDITSGNLLKDFTGHTDWVNSAIFSPDGKMIESASKDGTVKIWDVATGKLLNDFRGYSAGYFSPDSKMVVSTSGYRKIKIWNAMSGELIHDLSGHTKLLQYARFIPESKMIAIRSSDGIVKIWDSEKGQILHIIKLYKNWDHTGQFSFDGKMIVTWNTRTIKIWDLSLGKPIHDFTDHSDYIFTAQFSPDNKLIASASADKTIKIWDVASGSLIRTLVAHTDRVSSAKFSPDGKLIVSSSWDNTIKIWDVASGSLIHDLIGSREIFSPNSKMMGAVHGNVIKIWDTATGKLLHTFSGHTSYINSLQFSADGKLIVSSGLDDTIKVWDVNSGTLIHDFIEPDGWVESAYFSPDGRTVLSVTNIEGLLNIKIWDVTSGKNIRQFEFRGSPYHGFTFEEINFEQDLLLSYRNSELIFHRISDGKELFSFIPIDSMDWVVVDPEGRFDATQNAMNLMHFVLGDEIIEFQQLKDRYYEPGLMNKVLGYSDEPLRKSRGLNNILLHPTIDLTHPSENKGKLGIELTNRGGGIGKVKIWINGKEVETDVRGKKPKRNAKELKINYNIQDHPYIKTGELNIIEVKAYNEEEYLVSQGKKIYYMADGTKEEPKLYAMVAGSSNYSGDALDLNYAAKDAVEFANALTLVGNRLFGTDKVDIRLLTTQQKDFAFWPTKENIERTFREISNKANPFDVFVVYLSGHGTNYGGSEGDFYYLTSDAASGNLTDPVVRKQVAISSEEFTEYIKWVPALKQVMILDACNSGQLAEDLLAKKEARSSAEIRALERMKDRTGMYVLAGSAADAVSYETSIYGQGLLTYSLLFGMKGASLRESKYVDVMQLFQFAADKVPELAENIGGIQKPEVRIPYGGESFDIGLVTEEEQTKIILPSPKPLFLRSSFSDEDTFDDHLRLSEMLDEKISELQAMGSEVIFIDAARFTDAYSLKGRYVKKGDNYVVQVRLFKGDDAINKFDVEGSSTSEIVEKIMESALQQME